MHRTPDKIAALRNTALFGNLDDSVLRVIAARASSRQLERDEVLYCEHDPVLALFVVSAGELRLTRQNIEGREQVLSTDGPGLVLAAVPIFDGGEFYGTAIADTHSEILSIDKRDVYELCRQYPQILWNLARILAKELRHSAQTIESLALRNVDQRVAQYLLSVCQKRGVESGGVCLVEITMSRAEIATRLGSTREVVSRAFSHLENRGLIHMQGRRLMTIPDTRALSAFAGEEPPLERAG